MSFNKSWVYLALASLGSVLCFTYVWHDLTHQHTEVLPEVPERVPLVMSLRRCSDIMDARRLMTDIQLRSRWPGGDTSPIVWEVRVMDVRTDPRGGNGLMVYFACPDSGKLQMAGTFYTTTGAIGHDGGVGLNRGDIITVRGNLHREIEGWGASLSELFIDDTLTH